MSRLRTTGPDPPATTNRDLPPPLRLVPSLMAETSQRKARERQGESQRKSQALAKPAQPPLGCEPLAAAARGFRCVFYFRHGPLPY